MDRNGNSFLRPSGEEDKVIAEIVMSPFLTIETEAIQRLAITPSQCVDWVREAFLHKKECILSPKISQKPTPDSFFNTMPCCVPAYNMMGVKVVSRLPGNNPPLKSIVNLFDLKTGNLVALIEADWITAMRTGAVAALAAKTFVNEFDKASFGLVGLGSTATATLECLNSLLSGRHGDVWLFEYKGRANDFAQSLARLSNISFHIAHSKEELVAHTNALFSCVTYMGEQFLPPERFPAGYTLIPVHTRGFQDCDFVFDHIFGDDTDHIKEFKNFNKFKTFAEFGDVLSGTTAGRRSASDRIISYNVGIGLHDVWYASKIYKMIVNG